MTVEPTETAGAEPRAQSEGNEGGAWSVDQAVAFLDGIDDDEGGEGAGQEAQAPAAATPSEGAISDPNDAAGGAENPAGEGDKGEGAEAGAENPLEAPLYWSPEAKAKFATLDPELQTEILKQEGPREQAAAKAKDEAQQIKAKAESELQGVQRFAEEIGKFLPQAVQTFRSRWGDNPDWVAFAQQHGADKMAVAKAQYDQERADLGKLAEASKEAEQQAERAYFQAEFQTLQQIAPDLADPKEGPAKRTEITKYLVEELKFPPAQVRKISAMEMALARDAMLWRRAQAAKPTPAPKPAPAQTRPLARGGAAPAPSDPKMKASQQARGRFVKSGSVNDAVAWLESLED